MTPLTPQQHQIVALLAEGLSPSQIAERLALRPRSVRFYIELAAKRVGGQGAPVQRLLIWWFREASASAAQLR